MNLSAGWTGDRPSPLQLGVILLLGICAVLIAAVLVAGAELAGGSLGPLFASFVVTDADVRGSLGFGAIALAVTVVIAIALHRRERVGPIPVAEA